jgi:type I restriction enzyme S subunit
MNKTLEAIGQAIFKHWFVDFEFPNDEGKPYKSSGGEMVYNEELGKEIPKGWRVSKIGDELKTTLGGTPSTNKKEYWEHGNIPWINSGAINDFPIINASQHITEAGLNNSATQLMPKKTVVLPFVVSINKYIRISITGIETSGNQSVLGIVENKKIPCEFIYYWIEKMKDNIYSWATGGAQQHINKNNVDNTPILIPTNNVMNNFKKLLIPIFDKILNNSYEIQTLSQLRDSLLPKLMSGKIRVPLEGKE